MGNELSSRKGYFGRHKKSPHKKKSKNNRHQAPSSNTTDPVPQTLSPASHNHTSQAPTRHTSSPAAPVNSNDNAYLSVDGLGVAETSGSRASSRSSLYHQCPSDTESPRTNNDQVLPKTGHSSGLFKHASNFKIDNTIMGEHVEVHQHHRDTSILEKMKAAYVTIEAEFDSSDRENAPKCHPGTRTRFLEELKERIRSSTRITWLFGPAGVGKSAIMQTLAETLAPPVVCLSFFFSRPNGRDDPKKVFPTLAYRLATINDAYRRYLEENLARDPYFLAKNLDEQFKRLFVDPFANQHIGGIPSCVVILDGLDEADGLHAQRRILDLIQNYVERDQSATSPISWIIASRPEPHLQTSFSRIGVKVPDCYWKLEIPIDSDGAAREVEMYIRAAFMKIREEFSDVVPAQWPLEADLLKLATSSSGLFIFASTSMGYIGDENPVQRLRHIVSLIDHYKACSGNARPNLKRNPFEILDILYRTILDNISTDTLPITRAIVGFYLLDDNVTGTPAFLVACKVLEYEQSDAYAALRALHSVLRLPPPEDSKTPLKFLHASFSDFLRDKSRSIGHWIDIDEEMRNLWRCYVKLFRRVMKTTYPELNLLTGPMARKRVEDDPVLKYQSTHNWLNMLQIYCHDFPCSCGIQNHLMLDTAELFVVFKEFSSVLFCPELLFRFPVVQTVMAWLFDTDTHAPTAFLKHVHRQTMTLNEFDEHNFGCILTGLKLRRSAFFQDSKYPLFKLDAFDVSDAQWEKVKSEPSTSSWYFGFLDLTQDWTLLGQLMHLEKEHQTKCRIDIFGIRDSGLWAVIVGRFHLQDYGSANHLVFPYVEPADTL